MTSLTKYPGQCYVLKGRTGEITTRKIASREKEKKALVLNNGWKKKMPLSFVWPATAAERQLAPKYEHTKADEICYGKGNEEKNGGNTHCCAGTWWCGKIW